MAARKKVAVIGTQGVPAHYGGFEALVENIIGENCSSNVSYTVFCSSQVMDRSLPRYKGAELRYVPIYPHGARSVAYDFVSLCKSLHGYDAILVLGVSGCIFLPVLKHFTKAKIIVNIDGHEYRRHKWGSFARFFLRLSEKMAVRHADTVVTDNIGIREYVARVYKRQSELIAYGGDQVVRPLDRESQLHVLHRLGIDGEYAFALCRIEPENNCHLILEVFDGLAENLVFVGNWGHSRYSIDLYHRYRNHPNMRLLDPVYDLNDLYALRNNARCYLHGHSAGGTNPSLVEALFFPAPVIAYDVIYNRATTFDRALYFRDAASLRNLIKNLPDPSSTLVDLAYKNYSWASIAKSYEALYGD